MRQHLVDSIDRDIGNNHVHDLVVILGIQDRLVVQEVTVAILGMSPVVDFVALVIGALYLAQILLLRTGIFGGSEAILGGTQYLGQSFLGGGFGHALLGNDN